ncbi:hypothetical protein [Sporomusa acidovorans]|uniref:Uncharacterized protein n=1 Tax=Sporomusa acidovorans (strain ATCC 49682 / DSM 3132 / Mol) TaxID=1123286 RepID=A0ABZ3IWT8_SPOA4|nr:hypothetical protein [Sporomusa acidovorans]OZC23389.1 hypothetical protein SPACI_08010 [Sporomusa acidovorans DSM 3132]SDE43929.1 hypothetical protein SAMN04488499_1013103 [Sporomusa acidovorans]
MKMRYIVLMFAVVAVLAFAAVEALQKPAAVPAVSKAPPPTAAVSSKGGDKEPGIPKTKKALVV